MRNNREKKKKGSGVRSFFKGGKGGEGSFFPVFFLASPSGPLFSIFLFVSDASEGFERPSFEADTGELLGRC